MCILLIVLAGGVFILYTAVKEISHMLQLDHGQGLMVKRAEQCNLPFLWIVIMNLVFHLIPF